MVHWSKSCYIYSVIFLIKSKMLKVVAFMKQVAEELRMGGNFGTAHVYRSSINAIIAYHGEGDFSFDEVSKYTFVGEDVVGTQSPLI